MVLSLIVNIGLVDLAHLPIGYRLIIFTVFTVLQ